ncbi:MAG: hypothetical protein H6729_16235 [Deltaproteobacteria bacterium]|nr:hypothetical protein [Deltaproteobacteria bacterium]
MLPDYDQFDGALDVPPSQLSFELRARRVAESKTYWLLAGWGGCYEAFCFGAAPTAAFLIDDGYDVTTVYLAADETTVAEASTSNKLLRMAFAIGAQFGAQFEPTMGLRLGFVVRTPMRSIWTDGEFLHVSTFVSQPASEAQSYVDRVESQDPRLDFRLPWRFAVGAAYSVPNAWAIALDLRLTLGQSEYAAVAGPNGEASMQPATPNGSITDVNRAINVAQYVRLVPAANMNVGGRVYLSETLVLQGGLFTDLSATSKNDVIRLDQERLSRVGATLGAAWFGESTRTWVTVLGALGSGSAPGFGLATDGSGFIATLTHLDSKTIMLLIGSSATL